MAELLPFQKQDFVGIYEVMQERPVNIRLLDPPLHEFLPHDKESIAALAEDMGVAPETIKAIIPKPLAHRQSQHNNTLLSVSYLPVRSSLP